MSDSDDPSSTKHELSLRQRSPASVDQAKGRERMYHVNFSSLGPISDDIASKTAAFTNWVRNDPPMGRIEGNLLSTNMYL